jgi:hypothetical protein
LVTEEVPFAPDLERFKSLELFPAVEVEDKLTRLPVVMELLAIEKALAVVVVKSQEVVLVDIERDWLPVGFVIEFHLVAIAPWSVQVGAPEPLEVSNCPEDPAVVWATVPLVPLV